MKITRIDAFQVRWSPDDKPAQRSAFVRVYTDDGIDGIGEASPMQGGLASLGIIARNIAPSADRQGPAGPRGACWTRLMHACVKLGPEGALTGALAALDIAMWDLKGKLTRAADLQAAGRRMAHRAAVLRLDRRQRRAHRGRGAARR